MSDEASRTEADGTTIWLDVTDFYEYAKAGNTTVAGIQRVVANLVSLRSLSAIRVVPVITEYFHQAVYQPDQDIFSGLVDAMQEGSASRDEIADLVDRTYASRKPAHPAPGDMFVFPGCFWIYSHFDLLAKLRNQGLGICLFVHDLIQINNPEFVSEQATEIFVRKFIDIVAICDNILANSVFVAEATQRFLRDKLEMDCPVGVVRLATQAPIQSSRAVGAPVAQSNANEGFVLCVGTIEVRKNHKLLLRIWDRLTHVDPTSVPRLVLAGKWGWMVEDLRADIQAKAAERPWLSVQQSVSDSEMARLYEGALFTIYPSFAEGWGLPVGESLAYGTPCIASNATSIPEVGGDLVRYFDPHDVEEAFAVVRSALADRAALADWRARIKREFRPRNWADFSREFYDALIASSRERHEVTRHINYGLPADRILLCGDKDVDRLFREDDRLLTFRMARRSGWAPVDPCGAWAREPEATLEFQSNLEPGTEFVLYVRACVPNDGPKAATIAAGMVPKRAVFRELPHFVVLYGKTTQDRRIVVRFTPDWGAHQVHSDQTSWLHLSALAYCVKGDAGARLRLTERIAAEASGPSYQGEADQGQASLSASFVAGDVALLRRFSIERAEPRRQRSFVKRLACAWLLRSARRHRREGSLRKAENAYRRLLWISPGRSKVWVQYGHTVKDRGDLDAAVAAYKNALWLDPTDDEARQQYASALQLIGRHAEANGVRHGIDRTLQGTSE